MKRAKRCLIAVILAFLLCVSGSNNAVQAASITLAVNSNSISFGSVTLNGGPVSVNGTCSIFLYRDTNQNVLVTASPLAAEFVDSRGQSFPVEEMIARDTSVAPVIETPLAYGKEARCDFWPAGSWFPFHFATLNFRLDLTGYEAPNLAGESYSVTIRITAVFQ